MPQSEELSGYSLNYALDLEGAAESLITGYKDQMKLALTRTLARNLDAAAGQLGEIPEILVFPHHQEQILQGAASTPSNSSARKV